MHHMEKLDSADSVEEDLKDVEQKVEQEIRKKRIINEGSYYNKR